MHGVPATVKFQGAEQLCLLAWSVSMIDAGIRQDAVFQIALS